MNLIVKNARYELTAVKPEQYPASEIPEIAFAGRSNVGKSSLINAMVNRKSLARVGATPGKTRQINFYNIDEKLYFVDLPGYGYANVSKAEKASWGKMIEAYLNVREQLELVVMLVDIRHKPTEDDKLMYGWLRSMEISSIVVATKADKISRGQVAARLADIRKTLEMEDGVKLLHFSSDKKVGIEELWREIESIVC